MQRPNIILDRSVALAIQIIRTIPRLKEGAACQVIAKQLIRSGTSIGANVTEAQDASSSKDFTQKMSIALREAKETKYWMKLLTETELTETKYLRPLNSEIDQIVAILSKIVMTSKR